MKFHDLKLWKFEIEIFYDKSSTTRFYIVLIDEKAKPRHSTPIRVYSHFELDILKHDSDKNDNR